MPFVTEEIYQALPHVEESICISTYPEIQKQYEDRKAVEMITYLIEIVQGLREIRTKYTIKKTQEIVYHVHLVNDELKDYENELAPYIAHLINASCQGMDTGSLKEETAVFTLHHGHAVEVPLAGLVDITMEIQKQEKEKARLASEIARCEKMLANPGFVNKAPEAKISAEREKLTNYKQQYDTVCAHLASLKK